MPADARKKLADFTAKAYKTYHGSDQGLTDLMAMAKANAMPPSDFKIKSTVEIAQEADAAQKALDAADPAMAVWRTLKEGLTGTSGDAFLDSAKGAEFPGKDPGDASKTLKWKGKIVSMQPAIRPKTLVLAVQNPAGDVTLKFEMPLPGKMEVGTELTFSGVMDSVVKDPYMLTLTSDKEQIEGWKPEPAAPKKAVPAKKKAQ